MSEDRELDHSLEELRNQTGPTDVPVERSSQQAEVKHELVKRNTHVSVNEGRIRIGEKKIQHQRPGQKLEAFELGYGKLFWILRLNAAEVGRSLGKGRGRGSPNGLIRPDLRSDRVAVLRSDVHQRVGEKPEICRRYG